MKSQFGNDGTSNMGDISQMVMGIDNTVQWGLLYQMMFFQLLKMHSVGKDKEARTLFDNMVGHFYGIFDWVFMNNCEMVDRIVEGPEFKSKYTPEQLLNQAYWLKVGELSRLMVRTGHAPKPDVMLIPNVKWEVPKDIGSLSLSGEEVGGGRGDDDDEEDDTGTQYVTSEAMLARAEQEAIHVLNTPLELPLQPAPSPARIVAEIPAERATNASEDSTEEPACAEPVTSPGPEEVHDASYFSQKISDLLSAPNADPDDVMRGLLKTVMEKKKQEATLLADDTPENEVPQAPIAPAAPVPEPKQKPAQKATAKAPAKKAPAPTTPSKQVSDTGTVGAPDMGALLLSTVAKKQGSLKGLAKKPEDKA